MRSLIRRLFPMHIDTVPGWRPKHRGRPALVARRPFEHQGATEGWSPKLAVAEAEAAREPEELMAEAAEREAEELARHRADVERAAEEEVAAECAAVLDPVLGPLAAAVDDACRVVLRELGLSDDEADKLLARHRSAAEPTGGWPIVRDLAGVAA